MYTSDSIDNNTAMVYYDFDNPIYHADEDCELHEDLARLLQHESKVIQPHQESMEIINIGTQENKKEVKIGATIEDNLTKKLIELLHEYVDVVVWSYHDMSGLDTYIVVHKMPLKEECQSIKKNLIRTRPDMTIKIKEDVQKQLDAKFLVVENYPLWVAKTMSVPKKYGKV